MALTENTLKLRRELAGLDAIRQAASNFSRIAGAMRILFVNPRLHDAFSLSSRLIASGMLDNSGQTDLAIANSNRPDSSIDDEPTKPVGSQRRHHASKSSERDSSFPNLKILLGIFASMYCSVVASPSPNRQTHQRHPVNRDKLKTGPLADAKQSVARLLGQLAAPFVPVLNRTLVRATRIVNDVTAFLKTNAAISDIATWALDAFGALVVLGTAVKLVKSTLVEPFKEGLRVALSPVFALRWLASVVDFGAILVEVRLASYFVLGSIAAAIVGLAVAGYELYHHWVAAKRLLSRSIESAHRAVANLMKWIADETRNATAQTGNSIASISATLPRTQQLLTDTAPAMRALNGARAVERGAAGARPAPMLGAVRRATLATAFAAPLMFAGASAGALATPLISTSDTTRVASQSVPFTTQGAIVIDYSPNVVIHCGDAADAAALKRRVMEILERHGRELHQVLQREMVRQQRTDFQPRYSNEQG